MTTMTDDWFLRAGEICLKRGGHCCYDVHPPVSEHCYERLARAGVSPDCFEYNGYRRLKTRKNGECILSVGRKCAVHAIKPGTCRAGPFTFDVKDDLNGLYLKYENICPVVTLLKEVPEAFRQQYDQAVGSITWLVSRLTDAEIGAICRIDEPETEKVAGIPGRRKQE
jgi:Fe-S-cluster containining protein